jgi:uncharacterized protein (DUF1501 family)
MRHLPSRRDFLLGLAASLAMAQGGYAAPGDAPAQPVLVFIFLRGAMDGLSAIVPYSEQRYYEERGSIAIPAPGKGTETAIDLDGQFGLHPSLSPLLPAYQGGELGLVHAVGSPDDTRSHFDAQDYMELGTPGMKRGTGWLTRVLAELQNAGESPAFALEEPLPRSLLGEQRALAMDGLSRLRGEGEGAVPTAIQAGFERMYRGEDDLVRRTGADAFRLLERLQPLIDTPSQATYPDEPIAQSLADIARLVRARLGRVFTVSMNKWDTHRGQGSTDGTLAKRLRTLSTSLAAFRQDLGDDFGRTLVLAATEFGRTFRQNGTGGTDHGHGSAMFAFGGKVRGGKVYGRWPGLADDQLHHGRDLAVTTDFRQVFAEAAVKHLGVSNTAPLFPDFTVDPKQFLGLLA